MVRNVNLISMLIKSTIFGHVCACPIELYSVLELPDNFR